MKKSTWVLIILLLLDMLTTVYLLKYIPYTVEINPLLNQFENVVLAVIISHIIAILLVYSIDIKTRVVEGRSKIKLDIFMTLIILFYFSIVVFNFINIILAHYYII